MQCRRRRRGDGVVRARTRTPRRGLRVRRRRRTRARPRRRERRGVRCADRVGGRGHAATAQGGSVVHRAARGRGRPYARRGDGHTASCGDGRGCRSCRSCSLGRGRVADGGDRSRSRRRRRRRRRGGHRCRCGRGDRRGLDGCRRGRRRGRRRGDDRHGSRRRGGASRPRRQEGQRVEVSLRLGGGPDAQVHVRRVDLGVAAQPHRPDDGAFGDGVAPADPNRREVRQGDGEAVGRLDRERAAGGGDRAREGDGPFRRSAYGAARLTRHVDAAVLAGGVRVRRVERERLEHRAGRRPRPCVRGRRSEQRGQSRNDDETTHPHHPFCCPERERLPRG
jgi:hypothetical protein